MKMSIFHFATIYNICILSMTELDDLLEWFNVKCKYANRIVRYELFLMTIVMFALFLIIYVIFTTKIKCQKFYLENEGQEEKFDFLTANVRF